MSHSSKTGQIIIGILLALLLGVFLTKTFFVNYYRVPQDGMYPAIKPGGLIFARLHPYKNVAAVKRGDVVVFKQIEEGETRFQIWRVIGLPGDEIKVRGESVTLNEEPLRQEKLRQEDQLTIFREHNGRAAYEVAIETAKPANLLPATFKVPPNHVFVLGDNRSNAQDSRHLGPVQFEKIVAKKL